MDINKIAFGVLGWTTSSSSASSTATATKAAVSHTSPQPAMRHIITGWSVSVDKVVATAGTLVVKDGTTAVFTRVIPVGFYGPYEVQLNRPYACAQASSASATIGTLGATVTGTIELQGMTVSD